MFGSVAAGEDQDRKEEVYNAHSVGLRFTKYKLWLRNDDSDFDFLTPADPGDELE